MYGQEFGLSRGEKLQFANIHPTAPVDVHLVRTVSTTGCLWLAWQLLVEAMCTIWGTHTLRHAPWGLMQILSNCEERFSEEQVEELIAVVQQHLF